MVGEGGLTEKDVEILNQGALKFLNSGKCTKVEFGDKSTSKPNTYYINCGGPNILFKPSELLVESNPSIKRNTKSTTQKTQPINCVEHT